MTPNRFSCAAQGAHRTFAPALRHLDAFDDVEIFEPETLDQYMHRSRTLATNEMEIDRHFDWAYDAQVRKDECGDVQLRSRIVMELGIQSDE